MSPSGRKHGGKEAEACHEATDGCRTHLLFGSLGRGVAIIRGRGEGTRNLRPNADDGGNHVAAFFGILASLAQFNHLDNRPNSESTTDEDFHDAFGNLELFVGQVILLHEVLLVVLMSLVHEGHQRALIQASLFQPLLSVLLFLLGDLLFDVLVDVGLHLLGCLEGVHTIALDVCAEGRPSHKGQGHTSDVARASRRGVQSLGAVGHGGREEEGSNTPGQQGVFDSTSASHLAVLLILGTTPSMGGGDCQEKVVDRASKTSYRLNDVQSAHHFVLLFHWHKRLLLTMFRGGRQESGEDFVVGLAILQRFDLIGSVQGLIDELMKALMVSAGLPGIGLILQNRSFEIEVVALLGGLPDDIFWCGRRSH
mmetsp:Transcript_2942/g.7106  ORF Transcript_2942/g.7106 Transcript_2942/m.7106 type:complete len:367 (+) Transcript_2942:131-1231(+)